MKKSALISTAISVCLLGASAFATVTITSPSNNSTVGTSVQFVATASSSSCSKGVGSMGIYPAPYQLSYVVNGSSLNTSLNLNPGTYNVVVEEWDNCGGATTSTVTITVKSGGTTGVFVTSPANNSTVGSPANFVATATTSCSLGVASMGIYTAPSQLAYVVSGASLNTNLTLSPGTYNTTVEEWDKCGGAATKPITITVNSSGKTFSNLQSSGGWNGYAQQPPTYADCTGCTPSGPGTTWAMYQNIKSPTLSGNSTQFNIGGTMDYSDVLWNNHLIGDFSSQGLPDTNHTLIPTLHNFTYDVYFYGSNLGASQALEFDINQFFSGMAFTWGHECRVGGGNEWDVWDNVNMKWVPTGISCYPLENAWNHLTIQVERTSGNQLLYQSITLNGVTHTLNWTYAPYSEPGWYGVTVNYQMDGNYVQSPYTVYLDKLNFTYQ
jgi:major membrane immunogen (membrane-anchored lipoprotein)